MQRSQHDCEQYGVEQGKYVLQHKSTLSSQLKREVKVRAEKGVAPSEELVVAIRPCQDGIVNKDEDDMRSLTEDPGDGDDGEDVGQSVHSAVARSLLTPEEEDSLEVESCAQRRAQPEVQLRQEKLRK